MEMLEMLKMQRQMLVEFLADMDLRIVQEEKALRERVDSPILSGDDERELGMAI